ncbi:MAG TPA: efflux RND transporter periplasmic adaptor subunit [Steroidobacteraceae bacterium]|jgi:cobalt-zinc-cadmium efflux system membrane fusion protein
MNQTFKRSQWLMFAGALLVACATGFFIARLTTSAAPPPVAAEASTSTKASDELKVSDESLNTMGISLETVAPSDLTAEVRAPATVVAAVNGQAVLSAHAAGTVIRLFKRLGDAVKAGETLAVVESREAGAMAADLTTAESKVELARSVLEREQSLFDQKVTPRQDLDTAKMQYAAAEADRKQARAAAAASGVTSDGRSIAITSPMAGRITWSKAELGAYVEPTTELFRIADPRYVLIEATVPVLDAKKIAARDAAKVITSAGDSLNGVVISVTPTLDQQTRSATVTLSISPGQSPPTPGEYAQVRMTTKAAKTQGFAVDDEAVQNFAGQAAVFVRTTTGFKLSPVTISARSGGRAWVVSGLKAGDVIAGKNAFLLKAEMGKGAGEEE